MNTWHGVEVRESEKNGQLFCSLAFPAKFGTSEVEKNFLMYLATQSPEVRGNATCQVFPELFYSALDQLLSLAVDTQDVEAARAILHEGNATLRFAIDGESAEIYSEKYDLPILEHFENLDAVLGQARAGVIALSICVTRERFSGNSKFESRINALINRLNEKKGMEQMARYLSECRVKTIE